MMENTLILTLTSLALANHLAPPIFCSHKNPSPNSNRNQRVYDSRQATRHGLPSRGRRGCPDLAARLLDIGKRIGGGSGGRRRRHLRRLSHSSRTPRLLEHPDVA